MFELTEHQKTSVERIATAPKNAALVADNTGAGKTITAVYTVIHPLVNAERTLVICPISTMDSWAETFNAHSDLPVHTVDSKTYETELERLKKKGERGVWLIGREWFSTATTTLWHKKKVVQKGGKTVEVDDTDLPPKRPAKWKWSTYNRYLDAVIVDEIHSNANRKSQRFRSLSQIKPQRLKIGMSATPGGDKFEGLWAVCRWLWPDDVDRSFWRWVTTWAKTEFDPHSQEGKKVVGEARPGEFVTSLPCYIKSAESVKVPVTTLRAKLGLYPEQAKQYNDMRERSIAWLEDNPLVADLPIVQKTRLRQMLLGTVTLESTDNDTEEVRYPKDTKSTKIDAVLAIMERHPDEQILVFVNSRHIPGIVVERLKAAGYTAEEWTGGTSKRKRAEIKARFMAQKTQVIVASVTSISDGTDGLQEVCNIEVWMNKPLWNIKTEQAEGRLNRRGQKAERVYRYELYVPHSADDEDYSINARKALSRSQTLVAN